jgi:lipoprotein-anchoring transpeptidase ErfK/SrfK
VVAALALLLGTTACSGDRPSLAAPQTVDPQEPAKLAELDPRAVDLVSVATAVVPQVAVYDAVDAPEPSRTFANPVASGGPLVFVVVRASGDRYEVQLPVAPAGATGWLAAADVTVARHNYRAEVRLSEFRLDVYLQGQVVRQIKLAVGRDGRPAPGDGYFVDELVQPPQLEPALGTFAFGLTGWGDGAAAFDGAPGQYGLHGTADTSTLGTTTERGSLAMSVADIEDLASFLPLGVPVTVVA